ncbi:hypothetical protein JL2886_02247 [Phaeobacter gallaeciensis]|uniref:Uncharacterized protein n=1 Tax=Phaeobacter gallaeciensis TaxID=60890 RepID=A0A1B0ZSF7_9RHOB|nr:hypothetical protein JL2886_02247 [Phaeobacter gallaeciensis]
MDGHLHTAFASPASGRGVIIKSEDTNARTGPLRAIHRGMSTMSQIPPQRPPEAMLTTVARPTLSGA